MTVAPPIPVHLFAGGNHVPDIDPNEWLLSTGIRSAAFQNVGDEVRGFVVRQPEMQQQRDFETNELKFWDDGTPALQMRVVLQTEQRDPDDPEDTGERAVYIRGLMARAVRQAVRVAGADGVEVGGKLLIQYVADGKPARRGLNPPKLYEAKYRAPERKATPVPDPDGPVPARTVSAAESAQEFQAVSGTTNHKDGVPF